MIPGAEIKEMIINNCHKLYLLNIKENSSELKEYIDKHIISICEGNSGSDLKIVKKELLDFLDRKKNSTTRMGAVAEFFVHLLLNSLGFNQECLFSNLEENSIKKGFDGYYSYNSKEWIMESKSGMITTQGISHPGKVKEAYEDLNDKISGRTTNNPWKNAYFHANLINVNTSESIRNNIKRFSDNFVLETYSDIEEFNIIPTSTIFLSDEWSEPDEVSILEKLCKKISEFKCKNILVICATKSSVEILQEILRT